MRPILLLFFLLPLLSPGQSRRGYISVAPQMDFLNGGAKVYGGRFDGNAYLLNGLSFGLGVGVAKFQGATPLYIPLYAKFGFVSEKDKGGAILTVEPGYAFYSNPLYTGNRTIKQTGDFTFFGGLGVVSKPNRGTRVHVLVGYSRYGFKTDGFRSMRDGLGVRVGLLL